MNISQPSKLLDLVMFWRFGRFDACCGKEVQYTEDFDVFMVFLMILAILAVFFIEYYQSQRDDTRKLEWNKLNRAKAAEYEKILRERMKEKENKNQRSYQKYSRYDLELGYCEERAKKY